VILGAVQSYGSGVFPPEIPSEVPRKNQIDRYMNHEKSDDRNAFQKQVEQERLEVRRS